MNRLAKMLSKLQRDRHGAAMVSMVIGMVVTIIIVIISLMVAMIISGQLSVYSAGTNYFSGVNNTLGNSTASTLFTNTFSALSLATILPFILVAALIIAAITGIMAFVAYRRRD